MRPLRSVEFDRRTGAGRTEPDQGHAAGCGTFASNDAIDAAEAFRIADRECRIRPRPRARDYLLRSLLHHSLGRFERSLSDLRQAAAIDAADPLVMRTVMLRDPESARRIEAAQALIDDERSSAADLAAAIDAILSLRGGPIVRIARQGRSVAGWIIRREPTNLTVAARSETQPIPVRLSHRREPWCPPGIGHLARFRLDCDPILPVEVTVRMPDTRPVVVNSYAVAAPALRLPQRQVPAGGPLALNVIVPVYEDPAATQACLAALSAQAATCPVRYWLVDDHSPDPRVTTLAEEAARRLGAELIVNRVNHGFAGSVNRAIERCTGGDVLLLNADVILPPDALQRLVRAAYSAPDIGTVMPMSGDSEFTSFPVPCQPNPACPDDLARAIDRAAQRANGDGVVDVANTIGFCLYLRQDCLARTGLLSQAYGRGYYEDVDLCLRAQEMGFRNVAATGLYVSHAGGRSFLGHKSPLLARNLPHLERRFPAYALRCATYVAADPLRASRSAIEEQLRPSGPTRLLIGQSALSGVALARRARQIGAEGGSVLLLSWLRGVEARVEMFEGFGPRSLHFALDAGGIGRLARYLADAGIVAVEIDDPNRMPDGLWGAVRACRAPLTILLGSLDAGRWVFGQPPAMGSGAPRRSTRPFDAVVALDTMARAYVDRHGSGGPDKVPQSGDGARPGATVAKTRIGILVPQAEVAVDALVLGLARRLTRRIAPDFVLLGASIDDRSLTGTGRIHVTGPIDLADYAGVIDDYGIDGLFSPYRTSMFGFIDDLARETGLPKAYFDWSGQWPAPQDGDLALPHAMSEAAVSGALMAWCNPIPSI